MVSGRQTLQLSFDAQSITLIQLLNTLVSAYPRIKPYLFDASTKELHPEMRVLLNGTKPRSVMALNTQLHDNDRLTFLATPSVH